MFAFGKIIIKKTILEEGYLVSLQCDCDTVTKYVLLLGFATSARSLFFRQGKVVVCFIFLTFCRTFEVESLVCFVQGMASQKDRTFN